MIIDYDSLSSLRAENKDKKIVLCGGIFDITHVGHILFLEDCKKYGDILVVCLGNDKFVKGYKGINRPILNEQIRLKTVDSLKPTDYVFLDKINEWNGENTLKDILVPIFRILKPDFYIVNEDAVGINERKNLAKHYNIKMVVLPRYCPKEFDKISTTKIIKLINKLKDSF